MKYEKILYYANIPYHIANHVVGENHTQVHRRIFGLAIMFIGVGMAHVSAHISSIIISICGDLVGYSLHGTGLIPFLHDLENAIKNGAKPQEQNKRNCETCTN